MCSQIEDKTYSASCQYISRHERLPLGECLDQKRDAEDQVLCCCILSWLAVDMCLDAESLVELLLRDGDGSHRAESIWAFPNIKLLMVPLPLPRSHIVDDGVTPHMIQSILLGDLEACFANDDSKFTFIIQSLRELWMRVDLVSIRDDGGETFGEDNWMCGLIDFV